MKPYLQKKLGEGIRCHESLTTRFVLFGFAVLISLYFLSSATNKAIAIIPMLIFWGIAFVHVMSAMPDFTAYDDGLRVQMRQNEYVISWDDIQQVHQTSINTRIRFSHLPDTSRWDRFTLSQGFVFMFWRENYLDVVDVLAHKLEDRFQKTI